MEEPKNVSLRYFDWIIKPCSLHTVCIRDLEKFNFIWRFDFRIEPIFATPSDNWKNATHFNSSQKWLRNKHLVLFTEVRSKSLTHSVCQVRNQVFKRHLRRVLEIIKIEFRFHYIPKVPLLININWCLNRKQIWKNCFILTKWLSIKAHFSWLQYCLKSLTFVIEICFFNLYYF